MIASHPGPEGAEDGSRLYGLVREYAGIGHHRTGTANERRTREWLTDQLHASGATHVREVGYSFPQFLVHDHEVTVDGRQVESLPLWYAGEGDHDTRLVLRRAAPAHGDAGGTGGGPLVERPDVHPERPAIVATTGVGGRLCVPNRAPASAVERPHALVAGSLASQLSEADVRFRARLERRRGESANVLATFGAQVGDAVVVTTPITGWFTCAGERGTGIAIALDLASRLASHHPVLFVGTTGHEIGYLGVEALLVTAQVGRPRAVVHVGASIAAGRPQDSGPVFAAERFALTTMSGKWLDELDAITAAAAFRVHHRPASWVGEGEVLRRLGVPMVSFLGTFPLFHTSDDLPALATSPALLSTACAAVVSAAELLVASTHHPGSSTDDGQGGWA